MNYLLDTCLLSEFTKLRPGEKVISRLGKQIEETLFLSVVTIGEIQKGISALAPSKKENSSKYGSGASFPAAIIASFH